MTLVWQATLPQLYGLLWAFHGLSGPHSLDNVMNLGAVCPPTRVPGTSQVTCTSKRLVCGSAWIVLLKVGPPIDAGTLLPTGGFIKNIIYTVWYARSSDWSKMWLARSSSTPVALDLVFALVYKYREIEYLLRIYHLEADDRLLTPFSANQASFRHGLLFHQYR